MPNIKKSRLPNNVVLIPNAVYLHFNTLDDHTFPLDEFIKSAQATRRVIDDINTQIFKGNLDYKIIVIPPEDGTFLAKFGLLLATATGIATFLNQSAELLEREVSISFIQSLTDRTPVQLAEGLGKTVRAAIEAKDEKVATQYVGHVISQCTKGFLEKTEAELLRSNINPENFKEAYKARNEIYQVCIGNPKIMGLGFDPTSNFPIEKSSFASRIVSIPEKTDEDPWAHQVINVRVESPNWNRYGNRKWLGKFEDDDKDKEIYFSILDEFFWEEVGRQSIPLKGIDSLVVQWVRPRHRGRQDAVVLKVLDFNGYKVSEALTEAEVKDFLAKSSHILEADEQNTNQLSLDL